MVIRTYIRTLLNDIFTKNIITKMFVNIYYKLKKKPSETVKFSFINPITHVEDKKTIVFQSVTGDTIDCK